jgi:hypothetical protein
MAKRKVTEKDIVEFLQAEGFREVKEADKNTPWYKKASKQPSCFKSDHREKSNSGQRNS